MGSQYIFMLLITQVKEVRDKKEAGKSRARFWEVSGSKMGKITGETHAFQDFD